MTVAAFTMVWNEAARLPRWIAYYGAQLGGENLFVLDDGSDDGSTDGLAPANVVNLQRSGAFDEFERARVVSEFACRLLGAFETVIFTDVDEFIVPQDGSSLSKAVSQTDVSTVTALGFDVMHHVGSEPPLRADLPIMAQRRHARFNPTYCKPLVTRTPIAWRPGFHFSDQPLAFGGLLLFHTRYADQGGGLARLAQSRGIAVKHAFHSHHWMAADEAFLAPLRVAATAAYIDFSDAEASAWEERLHERLAGDTRNAVARIRDLPELHPSYYRFGPAFSHVG